MKSMSIKQPDRLDNPSRFFTQPSSSRQRQYEALRAFFLDKLPAAEQGVTLMLHPDDVARVEQAFGAEECAKRHWRLQSDPTLSPGDLQLATELSSIDLTLAGRIDQLLRNFLRDNAD